MALIHHLRYMMTRRPKAWGPAEYGDTEHLLTGMKQLGFDLRPLDVDPAGYRAWVERALPVYEKANYYDGGRAPNFTEKSLEHYLAAELLELAPGREYLDIASASSPTPEIYETLYDCQAWRQDLLYPPGINGRQIGGDAASIPLPDASVDAMALHCSFEHFEGNSDSGFIREAARLLRPGGRLVILPLYLAPHRQIQTDPNYWEKLRPPFEDDPGAEIRFVVGWHNRHGRFYTPEQFDRRVRKNLSGMRLTIYHVHNAKQVDPSCYIRFAAVFEK